MSGTFGHHSRIRKGQKKLEAELLNDIIDNVKALSNLTVTPPLMIKKSKSGVFIGLNKFLLPGGALLLGRALEDIQPRSFGRWQKAIDDPDADKGDEDWDEEEDDEIYNPWGITIPYHARFQYAESVGANGPEIVMPDIADEWTAIDIPVFRREDVEPEIESQDGEIR